MSKTIVDSVVDDSPLLSISGNKMQRGGEMGFFEQGARSRAELGGFKARMNLWNCRYEMRGGLHHRGVGGFFLFGFVDGVGDGCHRNGRREVSLEMEGSKR